MRACTVLVDGQRVYPVWRWRHAGGKQIVTVEGLAREVCCIPYKLRLLRVSARLPYARDLRLRRLTG